MIVTVGVNVAVGQFLGRSIAHLKHFDIEVEIFPGHGMIGVEGDFIVIDSHYCKGMQAALAFTLNLHSDLNILARRKLFARYLQDRLRVMLPIAVSR